MQVRMEKNTSKFPLKTIPAIPRFKFDLRPEKINIELSKKQLAQIRLLTREWTRFDRARQHRKWRPLMSIKDNPSAWWKFAIGRILEETHQNRQRSSKKFLLTRANHLNGYCKAYRQKLEAYLADQLANATTTKENTPKVSAMSAIFDDTTFMKQIEHDSQFTYHELHLFRETVFRRMMREKMKDKESKNDDSGSNSDVNFELVSPDSDGKKIISTDEVDINPEISANQGGLYNWFTGWFSSGSSN
uniref:Vacuolar protein sorting-associated protein 13 extended chorein domain-containing protein n=1 Tax=Panagrolaimus sp. JU765 TaxID=591449 RepID=A0AC34Q2R8_9BILA